MRATTSSSTPSSSTRSSRRSWLRAGFRGAAMRLLLPSLRRLPRANREKVKPTPLALTRRRLHQTARRSPSLSLNRDRADGLVFEAKTKTYREEPARGHDVAQENRTACARSGLHASKSTHERQSSRFAGGPSCGQRVKILTVSWVLGVRRPRGSFWASNSSGSRDLE